MLRGAPPERGTRASDNSSPIQLKDAPLSPGAISLARSDATSAAAEVAEAARRSSFNSADGGDSAPGGLRLTADRLAAFELLELAQGAQELHELATLLDQQVRRALLLLLLLPAGENAWLREGTGGSKTFSDGRRCARNVPGSPPSLCRPPRCLTPHLCCPRL